MSDELDLIDHHTVGLRAYTVVSTLEVSSIAILSQCQLSFNIRSSAVTRARIDDDDDDFSPLNTGAL